MSRANGNETSIQDCPIGYGRAGPATRRPVFFPRDQDKPLRPEPRVLDGRGFRPYMTESFEGDVWEGPTTPTDVIGITRPIARSPPAASPVSSSPPRSRQRRRVGFAPGRQIAETLAAGASRLRDRAAGQGRLVKAASIDPGERCGDQRCRDRSRAVIRDDVGIPSLRRRGHRVRAAFVNSVIAEGFAPFGQRSGAAAKDSQGRRSFRPLRCS